MRYQFADIEIDEETFALRRGGEDQHVEPLVFDLIRFMAQRPGVIISKDELIDGVWQGRIVSDATIAGCIKSARKAVGDSGDAQRLIETVRGRGFRLRAEPTVGVPKPLTSPQLEQQADPTLTVIDVAILGDDPVLGDVAAAFGATLATVLTRIPLLGVRGPVSAASDQDDGGVGQASSFVLRTMLSKRAEAVRADIKVLESAYGLHVWARQFDIPISDDTVDQLLAAVLPQLEPQLVRAMFNALRTASGELSSRQRLLHALGTLAMRGWQRQSFVEAAQYLREAIAKDDGLALAHAHLALTLGLGHRFGILRDSEDVSAETESAALRAIELEPWDSNVLGIAACALADIGQPKRAIPYLRQAIDINPNNAQAWTALGSAQFFAGNSRAAVDALAHGMSISPMDARLAVWGSMLSMVKLESGNVDEALALARQACEQNALAYLPRVVLAAAALVGRDRRLAADAIEEALQIRPELTQAETSALVGDKLSNLLWRVIGRLQLGHQSAAVGSA